MKPKTLLVVDDCQDDVDLTLRALRRNKIGNEVVIARDGVEALDYLFGTGAYAGRDTSCQPEAILLDLKMPRMGGLEALRLLRDDRRTRNIPVVILTSSQEECDLVESYDFGANSYVRKPVDFVQFAEAVKHINLYWMVLNEVAPVDAKREGDAA